MVEQLDESSDRSSSFDEAWAEFAEIEQLLQETTDSSTRRKLERRKETVRAQLATLADGVLPPKSRTQTEAELRMWEQRHDDLFDRRINVTTQSSGDGASPGGSGVGAIMINEAIDKNLGRAEIEENIRRLRSELAETDDGVSSSEQ
ncbi:MAG: hypothetical protein V3V01_04785 [Acidimicrobiales bacterium]